MPQLKPPAEPGDQAGYAELIAAQGELPVFCCLTDLIFDATAFSLAFLAACPEFKAVRSQGSTAAGFVLLSDAQRGASDDERAHAGLGRAFPA
ncbi:hypothetical protein [Roseateles sp.]|uniref:hypothetical protein n=1 Tax=Roseateles sp. TaxID=1971397 RepID=UPI003D0DE729